MDGRAMDAAPGVANAAAMNPPPQMYANNYPGDGSPGFATWYPEAEYAYDDDLGGGLGDDGDVDGDGDGEGRDAKRRRIARACDMCRKKKIKCDGKMPKCSHCENYKTECNFTQVEKKRAPPKGAKYIEGLENRLGRMESLLRMSGLLAEDDGGKTDLGTLEKRLQERRMSSATMTGPAAAASAADVNGASPQSQLQQPRSATLPNRDSPATSTPKDAARAPTTTPPAADGAATTGSASQSQSGSRPGIKEPKEVDVLADQMCSLITNNVGETRYIGSSSGFSIFSPKGIQWVNEKTGDNSFKHMILSSAHGDKQTWDHWKPEVFNDLFARRVFKQLPSRQECFALLKDFFENFNCMFPLFHEPTFMHLVDKHYSLDPYEGSGWWASLNVALAIAHRLRVMSNVVSQEEDNHAWGYLKNAMAVMTELTMRNTDLLSVQALIGMALFLQGTSNPQPTFFLVAAAVRLSHSIGLHKRGSGFNLNEVESEQRKRVFWIAYLLDKDICLRSGRPPLQDDDDMNVDLPSEDPRDNVGNIPLVKEIDGKRTMNLFRKMCTFAQIQSRVYKQLYSVKASRQSDGELLNTIGELDAQLEEWKDEIPIDFRPENEINAAHTPLILHVVVLHFAYYNCLTTIHRMSVHHGYWTSRLSDYAIQGLNARPLNPRVFMSAALCVNAARASISLIRYIPQGDYACVWLILYYPVSALVTIFANILQNPQDARARSDLRLMSSVCSFLTMLERDAAESNGNVRRMLSVCSEFERIAKVVLDKAEGDMRGRGKRKQAERERKQQKGEENAVSTGLSEGKTLEQIQIETQAAYRRPVQTPSLRASIAGSQSGDSPPTWDASSPGTNGPEHGGGNNGRPGRPSQAQRQPFHRQHMEQQADAGQWTSPRTSMLLNNQHNPSPSFSNAPDLVSSPAQQYPFATPGSDMGPPFPNFATPDTLQFPDMGAVDGSGGGPGSGLGNTPDMAAGGGGVASFQQPFVPQDLWQMPMTLEWDWAEGLGTSAFGTGLMMDGAGFIGEDPSQLQPQPGGMPGPGQR